MNFEAISSHFINPDRSVTSHKREASLKFRAVWKGSYENTWHPRETFENANDTVAKYITFCTKGVGKAIYRAMVPLALFNMGDLTLIKEAMALRYHTDIED